MPYEYVKALLGGMLIGLSAIILLLADGKIAGISGMIGGLLRTRIQLNGWRLAFLGGLVAGGMLVRWVGGAAFSPLSGRSIGAIIAAGLLVGFGTQVGSGCTSGHGVCGIGRFSFRSLVATITFIAAGAVSVYVVHHVLGGTV
ncbi:MAG: hypothetical protein KCHDKBKB_01355 [Elusimicrobia bacterium]|nr:hypothetical protein [Elusimicrobiota bacterium]